MLGLARKRPAWSWSASGKHPAAKDYVTVGADNSWLAAFNKTVGLAYRMVVARKTEPAEPRPCFFWAAGPGRDLVVCGRLAHSRDGLGRPYPLTILGLGLFEDWVSVWDALPAVFSDAWQAMDRLARGPHESLGGFQRALAAIPPPDIRLPGVFETQRSMIREAMSRWGERESGDREVPSPGTGDPVFSIVLPDGLGDCGPCYWHHVVRQRAGSHRTPTAAFISGRSPKSVHLFFRPVGPNDLAGMWRGQ